MSLILLARALRGLVSETFALQRKLFGKHPFIDG